MAYQKDPQGLTRCFNYVNLMPAMPLPCAVPACRILLVDDNRHGLVARRILLEEEGYEVTSVDSPRLALEMFRSAPYDLVVTDYRMPEMNGVELIAQIRKSNEAIPVLLVSGLVGVLDLQPATTGADAVLCKDAHEPARLQRMVKSLMRRKGKIHTSR